jgi:hypothetical protein
LRRYVAPPVRVEAVACGAKLEKLGPDIGREEFLAPNVTPRGIPLLTHLFRFRRDFCAGGLMILFGSVAAVYGPTYRIGTLTRMGPGFMPTVLGIVLIFLGVLIAGFASAGDAEVSTPEMAVFFPNTRNGSPGFASSPGRRCSSSSVASRAWRRPRSPACSCRRSATATAPGKAL